MTTFRVAIIRQYERARVSENAKCQSSNLKLPAQRATLPGNEISFRLCP